MIQINYDKILKENTCHSLYKSIPLKQAVYCTTLFEVKAITLHFDNIGNKPHKSPNGCILEQDIENGVIIINNASWGYILGSESGFKY
jgi:hypothetical protein